jgi:hypothetical protein
MMIASGITGFNGASVPNVLPPEVIEVKEVLPQDNKKKEERKIERSMTVEQYVRNYFSDIPVMVEIA